EMNKLTKGAIATAAGVILLMGGAGTLASWNSNAVAGSAQTIAAGQLSVTAGAAGVWKSGSTTITPSTFKIVPGDSLTYTQTFNVVASGNNLLFTLAATPGAIAANSGSSADVALAAAVTGSASFTIAGSNIAASTTPGTYKVTAAGATTITVTMTVIFPYGSAGDNTTQNGSVSFGNGAVTVAQTQQP
ncbi:MAG: alternate-type signal peptide domain-containing protein, partial [Leifsonia sp.]